MEEDDILIAYYEGNVYRFLLDQYVFELPLFCGFCFDGCQIRYRLGDKTPNVQLVELEPTDSTEGFPYPNYPTMFPYYPLAPIEPTAVSVSDFMEILHQPLDITTGELIVMVPSQFALGVSLWGPHGDAEEVQTVFRVDLKPQPSEYPMSHAPGGNTRVTSQRFCNLLNRKMILRRLLSTYLRSRRVRWESRQTQKTVTVLQSIFCNTTVMSVPA